MPPFELPTSVAPFATRPRRVSAVGLQPPTIDTAISLSPLLDPANKRHTLAAYADFGAMDVPEPVAGEITTSPLAVTDESVTPHTPISLSSHGLSSVSANGQVTVTSTLLLRRATPAQRLIVDRGLLDVFSDSCAQARSKAQLHHALFLPDAPNGHDMRDRLSMRDSTMLRRRKSFLDSRTRTQSMDIAFSGEVKGSIMDRPKSMVGTKRTSQYGHARGHTEPPASTTTLTSPDRQRTAASDEPVADDIDADNADDTATAAGTSDFGTLRGREYGTFTRTTSVASVSPGPATRPLARRSLSLFRPNFDVFSSSTRPPVPTMVPMPPKDEAVKRAEKTVHRTASAINMYQRARQQSSKAKSTPASPTLRAQKEKEGPAQVQRASSDPARLEKAPSPTHGHQAEMKEAMQIPTDPRASRLVQSPSMTPDSSVPTPTDNVQAVYTRGQGLTNTPERDRNSWSGSIRRGVGMLKRGNSSANLVEMGSSSSLIVGLGLTTDSTEGVAVSNGDAASADAEGRGTGSPVPVTAVQRPEAPPVRRSNSSLFLSHFGGSKAELLGGGTKMEDEEERDRVDTTPKRRRSVKLLQTLRGFTPM